MSVVSRRLARGARTEQGVAAVIVALSMVMLLVASAMVLDFGLVRVDRQQMKLAADNAAMAGLRAGDSPGATDLRTYRAVCGALSFLKANQPTLQGLTDDFNTCTSPDLSLTCDKLHPFAAPRAANFQGTVTSGSTKYTVTIKSPYLLSDGGFPDESNYASLAGDPGDSAFGGCDQLGVIITSQRRPGLGSLATSSDLVTRLRSVGRVQVGDGDDSPALLLLERSLCGVLTVGSSGSPSRIQVAGSASPASVATIHSDSTATGSGCGSGSNKQLFQGHQGGGIVAYGDGTRDGFISSVATDNGVASNIVSDGLSNVYGTKGIYPTTSDTAPIQPRGQVTRVLVDKRYLTGVTTAVRGAYTEWNKPHGSPTGYTRYPCPSAADMTTLAALTATDSVYIDCPGSGITLNGTIGAGKIYFHGFIKGGVLNMPNATKVYVDDTNDSGARDFNSAITLSNNTAFCIRATAVAGNACDTANPSNGTCSINESHDPLAKAQLFIRRGMLSGGGTSSLLRLCSTTVIMEGGDLGSGSATSPGGCLPTVPVVGGPDFGTAPRTAPCPTASTTAGTSQINTSGSVDWTAPNAYEDLKASPINDNLAAKQALWDGGEDLALWDETYADNSGSTYGIQGGGYVHVAGVFMVPNANPFNVTGSAALDLTNSQFIVTKFSVDGGAILKMGVDPYNAVPLKKLTPFTLVR